MWWSLHKPSEYLISSFSSWFSVLMPSGTLVSGKSSSNNKDWLSCSTRVHLFKNTSLPPRPPCRPEDPHLKMLQLPGLRVKAVKHTNISHKYKMMKAVTRLTSRWRQLDLNLQDDLHFIHRQWRKVSTFTQVLHWSTVWGSVSIYLTL